MYYLLVSRTEMYYGIAILQKNSDGFSENAGLYGILIIQFVVLTEFAFLGQRTYTQGAFFVLVKAKVF